MANKERVKPPTRRELRDAGKQTRKRHSSGARVLAERALAIREGISKPSKKRTYKRSPAKRG